MAAKQIALAHEGRLALCRGVEQLTRAVRTTLGPAGHNVVLEKSFGAPNITKDGVTVAKEIELKDPYENMGAKMVREVASKTSDGAGDGTNTATILAEAILKEGMKNVAAGASPRELRNGIERAVSVVVDDIAARSVKVRTREEIANVGRIAANNDAEVGEMLAEAMEKVGKDGVITIEEGKSLSTEVRLVEGMQFDKGFASPYFITDAATRECVLEEPYILIHEKKISAVQELVPVLEKAAQAGKPLLIIAEEVEGEALATLVVNKLRGTLKICAVKAPGFGDRRKAMLEDIAIVTGGQVVTEELGIKLESVTMDMLGGAAQIKITKEETIIVDGRGETEAISGRINQIKTEIDQSDSEFDREKLQERLAKLSGGVAVIRVGAATETELKERKHRIEDALSATRAAVEEGIVPGGGVVLVDAIPAIDKVGLTDDEMTGALIIERALEEPLRQIAANAGLEGSVVVDKVKNLKAGEGLNAETGEYGNMVAAGIVDPAKVTRSALQNAASIASLILTTETIVADMPEESAGGMGGMPPGGMGGGMPGMM